MAWGSNDTYSPNEVLNFVLEDLKKEELHARKANSASIIGILIAEEIVRKHIGINYN